MRKAHRENVLYKQKHIGYVEYDASYPLGPVWWGVTKQDQKYTEPGSKARARKSVIDRYEFLLDYNKKKK